MSVHRKQKKKSRKFDICFDGTQTQTETAKTNKTFPYEHHLDAWDVFLFNLIHYPSSYCEPRREYSIARKIEKNLLFT